MTESRILPITSAMTYGQMRRALTGYGPYIYSRHLPDPFMGLYDEELQAITIDISLSYTQKRCVLVHELMHWRHGDAACPGSPSSKIERRARRDTARFLIDPIEYAALEAIYEGNKYRMASELDLTVQIVEDYQNLLHETLKRD